MNPAEMKKLSKMIKEMISSLRISVQRRSSKKSTRQEKGRSSALLMMVSIMARVIRKVLKNRNWRRRERRG
jgi:hypothetical protein